IVSAIVRHRPTKRITLDAIARLAVGGTHLVITRIYATQAPLHLLRKLACRLLQLVERLGLGRNRFARLATPQRFGRVAHRALSPPQRVRYVTEPIAEPA